MCTSRACITLRGRCSKGFRGTHRNLVVSAQILHRPRTMRPPGYIAKSVHVYLYSPLSIGMRDLAPPQATSRLPLRGTHRIFACVPLQPPIHRYEKRTAATGHVTPASQRYTCDLAPSMHRFTQNLYMCRTLHIDFSPFYTHQVESEIYLPQGVDTLS